MRGREGELRRVGLGLNFIPPIHQGQGESTPSLPPSHGADGVQGTTGYIREVYVKLELGLRNGYV